MHNICHYVYPENVDKKKVFNELNDYVEHVCWQEGGSLDHIRWENYPILENRRDAEEWISKHDRGWYDNLAVRFTKPVDKSTDKLIAIRNKIQETFKEYKARDSKLYAETVTSNYIGCKKCGSKLSREHLKSNSCPLCREELRPEHMLKNVLAAKNKYLRALKEENDYVEKHSKKEVCWLVKIEYHT